MQPGGKLYILERKIVVFVFMSYGSAHERVAITSEELLINCSVLQCREYIVSYPEGGRPSVSQNKNSQFRTATSVTLNVFLFSMMNVGDSVTAF